MLDVETKRKIDNCRDILVGKVPDPKGQVEQITIALIYKFMDDMDAQSIDMGGKPSFFTEEYEKYSWSSIFDPHTSGIELLNRYGEALVKLEKNPKIPQLFRDIFKNAYLPYRDPETLRAFLKEIRNFSYDHSERLGDAFEYLLSVLSSQGEAGQFRTPRHIIDFIVEVVSPQKHEKILDPACGTAGFLISAYRHILRNNPKLSMVQKKRLMDNFVGYDISYDMVRLSLVNMYLHGFSQPHIHEYDTLTYEDRWDDTFDVIMANPPFMSPKGGIRPHSHFAIRAKRSEVLFVDYIAEHLNPSGRAGVIVPEGIIFQSQNAYKALRKMLVENYLWAVISLPSGVFNPYSGVKTSILLMDKSLAKRIDKILFIKIENDGYDLGAQRRPIDKNDIPAALKFLNIYKSKAETYKSPACHSERSEESHFAHAVLKSEIAKSGEYNLSGDRYKTFEHIKSDWKMVEMGEVLDYEQPTNYIVNSVNYSDRYQTPVLTAGKTFILGYTNETEGIFPSEKLPVIIFDDFTTAIKLVDFPFKVKSSAMKILHTRKERADTTFLFYVMQKIEFARNEHKRYWISQYSKIKIPLPPLNVQQAIVSEIDGYQKIIDGARQVVENYKPSIKINPDWPIVELKSVTNIKTGKLNANKAIPNGKYPFFTCSKEIFRIDDYDFDCEALLLSGNNAAGVFDVKYYKGKFNAYQRTYIITINQENVGKLEYPFLHYQLEQHLELLKRKSIGSSTRYLTIGMIDSLQISIPNQNIQKQIVEQIETEQQIVKANKKMIEIYEQKIKDKITEIWGE